MFATIDSYLVNEEYPSHTYENAPSDWTEYTATLYADGGEILDEWDSLSETFNGCQR